MNDRQYHTACVFYFDRCEALGKLQRVIDAMQYLPISSREFLNSKYTVQICMQVLENEIVFYAATQGGRDNWKTN